MGYISIMGIYIQPTILAPSPVHISNPHKPWLKVILGTGVCSDRRMGLLTQVYILSTLFLFWSIDFFQIFKTLHISSNGPPNE
jgi:hypothetical protein